MKRTNLWKTGLTIALAFAWATALQADTLNVTLTTANQTVVEGTTLVVFEATVSNPSATDTIYLNGDSSTTDSTLVSLDDSPFFANAPLFLAPGDSRGPFEIFDLNLDPSLGPGLYTGVFSILGGADGGASTAFDDLADISFSVNVTSPVTTPEPASFLLLSISLISLGFLRRTSRLSRPERHPRNGPLV